MKPTNVDYVAKYESSDVAGGAAQMERIRSANSLKDRLAVIEEFNYPVPQLIPASAVEEYCKKFPKSVVIGRSNAANPKGIQVQEQHLFPLATCTKPQNKAAPKEEPLFEMQDKADRTSCAEVGWFHRALNRRMRSYVAPEP